jgi:hypothetical protein
MTTDLLPCKKWPRTSRITIWIFYSLLTILWLHPDVIYLLLMDIRPGGRLLEVAAWPHVFLALSLQLYAVLGLIALTWLSSEKGPSPSF